MKNATNYKFVALLLLMTSVALFTSCSDDDETKKLASGSFSFDGTTYDVNSGYIVDFGAGSTHFNYDFYLTDGSVSLGGFGVEVENETFELYLELYSNGTDGFTTGTFQYVPFGEDRTGLNYFDQLDLELPNTADIAIASLIESGTVTVTGSETNYTIDLDLDLTENRTLSGEVSGEFLLRSAN
ncbi:MAG: hypothetical protein KI790_12265 [Cyclobacteriaceae bacterium]|nr:hypothetical protein [Cyclobacteriaceae bacterium HetDA_MAG_MS6]